MQRRCPFHGFQEYVYVKSRGDKICSACINEGKYASLRQEAHEAFPTVIEPMKVQCGLSFGSVEASASRNRSRSYSS